MNLSIYYRNPQAQPLLYKDIQIGDRIQILEPHDNFPDIVINKPYPVISMGYSCSGILQEICNCTSHGICVTIHVPPKEGKGRFWNGMYEMQCCSLALGNIYGQKIK